MREKKSPGDRLRLPPLNALRAFEAAARRGNFAEAAADLNVTHWAVGKQVRLLEDWFGTPLFERRPHGIVLTDEGAELLDGVSASFSRLAAATAKLQRPPTARRISGAVRLSVPTSFALHWLIPRLPLFYREFPNIEVRISTTSRKLRYVGSAFDFGVRMTREPAAGLTSRVLMKDWQLPACSPEILRGQPVESIADLCRHTWLHASTTPSAWSGWLKAAGRPDASPVRQLELDHVHLQLQAAIEGLGFAMASLPLIERDIAAGRLICPIQRPKWHSGEYLLVNAGDETAASRTFRAWIVTAARGTVTP